jgi:putative spermidine/putrescine transport system substrate-binding protein
MLYVSPEYLKSTWSRRSLLKASAATIAAGVASSFSKIAAAEDGLRTIGLGVSIVNEVQEKATKDLGFTVAGQAMGYGEMFGKMLNQNDQYEIAEGYFNDMRVMGPAKVWQPIDTKKLKDWDKVTNLTKTGKLTPDSNEGQGDAPVKLMYCDAAAT